MKKNTQDFQLNIKSVELKAENPNIGIIKGYASIYGNLDSYRDIVMPGAFTESLMKNSNRVVALYQHSSHEPIGINFLDDSLEGLKTTIEVNLETQRGKEAYALAKQGALSGLSIGYYIQDYTEKLDSNDRAYWELTKLDLIEVSIVTFPANKESVVTEIKNDEKIKEKKEEKTMDPKILNEKTTELEAKIKEAATSEEVKSLSLEIEKLKASNEIKNVKSVEKIYVEKATNVELSPEALIKSDSYREAFKKSFLGKELSEKESNMIESAKKFFGTGTGSGISSVDPIIPKTVADGIISYLEAEMPLFAKVSKVFIRGAYSVSTGKLNGTVVWGATAQGVAPTPLEGTLTEILFSAYKIIATVEISREASIESVSGFESWLIQELTKHMMISIENGITTGLGAASQQPEGIFSATSVTNKLNITTDLITAATPSKIISKLPTNGYRAGAEFIMHPTTWYDLFEGMLDSTGQPITFTSLADSNVLRLKGYNVILSDYAPAYDSAEAKTLGYIALVNLAKAYTMKIDQAISLEKSVDEQFSKDKIVYKSVFMGDGKVVDPKAIIKVLDLAPTV